MNFVRFGLTALAVSVLCAEHAPAQSILSSSFETPDIPDITTIHPGDTLLEDWSVISGSVDLIDISNTRTLGPAFDGTQYIDLDGNPGTILRTFTTTPGLSYMVTFAYANNYYKQPGASVQVRLYGDSGIQLAIPLFHFSSQAGNLNWSVFSREFSAADDITTLEFSSSPSLAMAGILLDAVSVQQVPEPSAAVFLTGSLAPFLSRRKRRRH
jgi:hypothetical protein